MNIKRRALAIVISFLMILGSVSMCAFAANETGTTTITLSSSSPSGNNPGAIITITMNIANDYKATAFRWPIAFSNTVFELYDDGTGNPGDVSATGALAAAGSSLTAIDKSDDSAFFNSTYTNRRYGMLLVQWVGGQKNGRANYYNETAGSNCLTFKLRVKDNPSATTGVVIVPTGTPYSTYWYRQGITDPTDATTYYQISDANFTLNSTRCTVGVYTLPAGIQAAKNTDIIINDSFTEEIEAYTGIANAPGYIYGFTSVASSGDYPFDEATNDMHSFVETTGGAVAVYTMAQGAVGHGTGTFVQVYTNAEYEKLQAGQSATPFARYYIVIFGDINGDCYTDGVDVVMQLNAINYLYEWTYSTNPVCSPYYMACDINGDGLVSGDDYGAVVDVSNGLGYINQQYVTSGYYIAL